MLQEAKLIDISGNIFTESMELQLCDFYSHHSRIICLFNICKSAWEKENHEVLSSLTDKHESSLSYSTFNRNSDACRFYSLSYRVKSEREKQIPYANTYIWNLKKKNGSEEPRGRTGIKTQT